MDIVLDPSRHEEFEQLLEEADYTEQSLVQAAFSNKHFDIDKLNTQVMTLAKTLAGFQASYEVLVNRKFRITSYNVCYTKLLRWKIISFSRHDTIPPKGYKDVYYGVTAPNAKGPLAVSYNFV